LVKGESWLDAKIIHLEIQSDCKRNARAVLIKCLQFVMWLSDGIMHCDRTQTSPRCKNIATGNTADGLGQVGGATFTATPPPL